ncbi:hypothetical protein IWW38_006413, partial [Coemansia aciculifera]
GVFVEAAQRTKVGVAVLERLLPRDIVVWCDPYSVTYRVGDHGTVYTLYEDKRGLMESVKKNMAEKVARTSNGDFVISAYTTPVVIRSADGVEISRRGGASAPHQQQQQQQYYQQGSPTKSAVAAANDFRRANAMSPLRHVSNYRAAADRLSSPSPSPAPAVQKSLLGANTRWTASSAVP